MSFACGCGAGGRARIFLCAATLGGAKRPAVVAVVQVDVDVVAFVLCDAGHAPGELSVAAGNIAQLLFEPALVQAFGGLQGLVEVGFCLRAQGGGGEGEAGADEDVAFEAQAQLEGGALCLLGGVGEAAGDVLAVDRDEAFFADGEAAAEAGDGGEWGDVQAAKLEVAGCGIDADLCGHG